MHNRKGEESNTEDYTDAFPAEGIRFLSPMKDITLHKQKASDFLLIIFGTALMAASTNLFYDPVGMVPGGFTGLAMMLRKLTGDAIPVWLGNMLLNVPLILFSIRIRGWRFLKWTFIASLLYSAWLYLIPTYPVAQSDLFLTTVIGGALMGVGMGLVFYGKATTGGSDTLAALIQHALPHLSTAKIMPVIDGVIILLSIWIFGFRVSLYAVISVVLIGWIADGLMGVFRNAYLAYIISDKYREISTRIMEEMDRGTTLLSGKGMYTSADRPVLFCAVSRKQGVVLKDLVYEVDPNAFVVMTDAREVRGEGFLFYSSEEF